MNAERGTSGSGCDHARTQTPSRPIPDWSAVCPDCRERVTHGGRGTFVTIREVNANITEENRAVDEFRKRWREEHR